jgi:hypothetical protein
MRVRVLVVNYGMDGYTVTVIKNLFLDEDTNALKHSITLKTYVGGKKVKLIQFLGVRKGEYDQEFYHSGT